MVIFLSSRARRRVVLTLSLVLVILGARVGLGLSENWSAPVVRIAPLSEFKTNGPYVGLAVDVGAAEPDGVEECLQLLHNLAVKATWFASTTFIEAHGENVKDIADQGHEFGVKGSDEKAMDRLPPSDIGDRLVRSRQALLKQGLEPVPFFLPPAGKLSDTLVSAAFQHGFHAIKPGVDARSMRGKEEGAAEKLTKMLKPGSVILIKIGKTGVEPQARYLTKLAETIRESGLTLVTLSALIKGGR